MYQNGDGNSCTTDMISIEEYLIRRKRIRQNNQYEYEQDKSALVKEHSVLELEMLYV